MRCYPLGIVAVPTPGTPVKIVTAAGYTGPTDCCQILVATVPGLTGNIYLGTSDLNATTGAGVIVKFNPPSIAGPPDGFRLPADPTEGNELHADEYYLDASVGTEGAYVTIWVR